MEFIKSDAGRAKYFKGKRTGDCVTRAITHATGKDYKEVYDALYDIAKTWGSRKTKKTLQIRKEASPRNGVHKDVYKHYIENVLGFKWVATMSIGTGTKVHLKEDELPKGILILNLSKHLTCVKNGVLYDTYDCSRNGKRAVYGFWTKTDVIEDIVQEILELEKEQFLLKTALSACENRLTAIKNKLNV